MTNSEETSTRPVSVAELLAKNGTIGSPPAGGRRRRRRGNADAVTVAELTGEIPVIRTGSFPVVTEQDLRDAEAAEQAKKPATEPAAEPAETAPADPAGDTQTAEEAAEAEAAAERRAEELKQAREAREAEQARRRVAAEVAAVAEAAEDDGDDDGEPEPVALRSAPATGGGNRLMYGAAIALQSVVAVAFGAGLFLAFDRLWQWNSIIALVLSVLVILGLVIGVRVVRKTEDIASTLIAVAVGALVTLGPLAMLQSV